MPRWLQAYATWVQVGHVGPVGCHLARLRVHPSARFEHVLPHVALVRPHVCLQPIIVRADRSVARPVGLAHRAAHARHD